MFQLPANLTLVSAAAISLQETCRKHPPQSSALPLAHARRRSLSRGCGIQCCKVKMCFRTLATPQAQSIALSCRAHHASCTPGACAHWVQLLRLTRWAGAWTSLEKSISDLIQRRRVWTTGMKYAAVAPTNPCPAGASYPPCLGTRLMVQHRPRDREPLVGRCINRKIVCASNRLQLVPCWQTNKHTLIQHDRASSDVCLMLGAALPVTVRRGHRGNTEPGLLK
jgi:hypothetical protein